MASLPESYWIFQRLREWEERETWRPTPVDHHKAWAALDKLHEATTGGDPEAAYALSDQFLDFRFRFIGLGSGIRKPMVAPRRHERVRRWWDGHLTPDCGPWFRDELDERLTAWGHLSWRDNVHPHKNQWLIEQMEYENKRHGRQYDVDQARADVFANRVPWTKSAVPRKQRIAVLLTAVTDLGLWALWRAITCNTDASRAALLLAELDSPMGSGPGSAIRGLASRRDRSKKFEDCNEPESPTAELAPCTASPTATSAAS